jgi:hypothetical protein
MPPPKGLPVEILPGKVHYIQKGLYGLKSSNRDWYLTINNFLEKLGFERVFSDFCIYIKQDTSGTIIIALYVDDLLRSGPSAAALQPVKNLLKQQYEMTT